MVNKTETKTETAYYVAIFSLSFAPWTLFRFKDGDILDIAANVTSMLTLNQLETEHSGLYRCRVSNRGGMMFSDGASLTVTTGKQYTLYFSYFLQNHEMNILIIQ